MELSPIKNGEQYDLILKWIDAQFNKTGAVEKSESDKIKAALELIKIFEDEHYPIL
ncbi:hypothetical protein [Dyadobacter sp. CY323]|uniref:hypothetical protein n=1 Tax=Dyadobacter sp. CY323 TaxID=2907302 RepID=UPI001F3601F9|nr:hypothetical protein [Dyadobacter sp. CY323]MCE6991010.1 hypothetical protein [Dyadobacter sp. CY323]